MSRLSQTLTCLLLLGSSTGCDLESAIDSLPEDLSFRCPCWGTGGLQNTFMLTDDSLAGVVRKDIVTPAFHESIGSSDSLRLDLVEVPLGGGWVPLVEIGANANGLYGYACPNQACRMQKGADFLGARFHFTHRTFVEGHPSDETKILRIEEWDDSELPSYRFVYDDAPQPAAPEAQVCPADADDNYFATVYEDLDVDLMTGNLFEPKIHPTLMFGCQSAAIVKADIFGYGMYSGFDRETHEATVRVVRADYCGDGNSWTLDNSLIHVQDTLGVEPDPITENDELEAIWGIDGAICVYEPRLWWIYDAAEIVCDGVPIPVCNSTDDINTYPDALFLTKLYEPGLTE